MTKKRKETQKELFEGSKKSNKRGKYWNDAKMAWCKTGSQDALKMSEVTDRKYPEGTDSLIETQFFNAYKRIVSWPVVDGKGKIVKPRRADVRYRYQSYLAKELSRFGWTASQVKTYWAAIKSEYKSVMGASFVDLGVNPPKFERKQRGSKKTLQDRLKELSVELNPVIKAGPNKGKRKSK
tara:strand:+ start:1627 stop:2169 length:543 start_codon:yes stop_codon:yes gene_type:complete